MGDKNGSLGAKLCKVEVVHLSNFMMIDAASLNCLDLIKEEEHPSLIRGNNKRKEGFSLLTLLESRVSSILGKRTLKTWISQPLNNVTMINERLESVDYIKTQDTYIAVSRYLNSVRDLPRILFRIRSRSATHVDWMHLAESINALLQMFSLLKLKWIGVPAHLRDLLDVSTDTLMHVKDVLAIVDWEETSLLEWLSPVSGVSQGLDQARQAYESLGDLLSHLTAEMRPHFPNMHMSVTYMPVVGFLAVSPKGNSLPAGFIQKFSDTVDGEQVTFSKGPFTDALDERYGDIHGHIREQAAAVERQIETEILKWHHELIRASLSSADIDVLEAFASLAEDLSYVRPSVNDSVVTHIEQGVHPLQVYSVDQYLANDITLLGTAVVTGANYSGKSAMLKMVAVLTVMAHIGCFVPATKAAIGLVDRIFTRIESFETSAICMESSFSLDAQQVAHMIQNKTQRSLLLIDEFGKGTVACDGASLLLAALKDISNSGCRCMVATHFLEIVNPVLLGDSFNKITVYEMLVMFENADSSELQVPLPLFICRKGSKASQSYALECAKRSQLPEEVLTRAATILALGKHGMRPTLNGENDKKICKTIELISKTNWEVASNEQVEEMAKIITCLNEFEI